MWKRRIRGLGVLLALGSLAGMCACGAFPQATQQAVQRSLPVRNKDACRAWMDHVLNLSCLDPDAELPSAEEIDMACEPFGGEQEDSPVAGCDFTDFFDCLSGQYSCVGGELAIGGVVLTEEQLVFGGGIFLLSPFETCGPTLDVATCSGFAQSE